LRKGRFGSMEMIKTTKQSAGILLYRKKDRIVEVFLVHPGGPFWKNKDDGSWMIPKGEIQEGEDAFDAALREFEQETSAPIIQRFLYVSPL
jgi:predicted NUDIX family NTP pyrophosphohydrolase